MDPRFISAGVGGRRRIVVELIGDDMAEALRRKTPAERLAATHAMWRAAHGRTLGLVRHLHPDWSDFQVRAEMRRRMLGPK